jgi:hypothetical protein
VSDKKDCIDNNGAVFLMSYVQGEDRQAALLPAATSTPSHSFFQMAGRMSVLSHDFSGVGRST